MLLTSPPSLLLMMTNARGEAEIKWLILERTNQMSQGMQQIPHLKEKSQFLNISPGNFPAQVKSQTSLWPLNKNKV